MEEYEVIVRGVLYVFGETGGIPPGKFAESLILSFRYANKREFAQLAMGFPQHANIIRAYLNGKLDKKYFSKI